MMSANLLTIVAFFCLISLSSAQSPKFEVASVKRQLAPATLASMVQAGLPRILPGGTFRATHVTVEGLLTFAHDLKRFQLVGGPDWVRSQLFSVEGRAGGDASQARIKLMIHSLLQERFSLASHEENRIMRHHTLVRAKGDRPLGPNVMRVDDCSVEKVRDTRKTVPWAAAPGESGALIGCSTGFADLASILSLRLERPVLDATRIDDRIFFTLRVGSSMAQLGADADVPSLAAALNEQLGLKMESRQGPIRVLVIDSIKPPTEN